MLGNFAAGVFMLVLRSFKVGDFVSIGPVSMCLRRSQQSGHHYWQVYFDTNEAVTRVTKEAGEPVPTQSSRQAARPRSSPLNNLKSAYDFPATLR
jgi:small-conductance mechanosensitive channel